MDSTQIVLTLNDFSHQLHKAVESYTANLDARQFQLAGYDLGRIIQIGRSIEALSGTARDALWRDSQRG